MDNDIERTLYSRKEIEQAVKKLGQQITKDYQDKKPVIISVLKGAILFTVDLIKELDIYAELDFLDVSTYGGGVASSGKVKLVRDLGIDVKGRNVLVLEDIVDSGITLEFMLDLLHSRGASDIKVASMLDKKDGRTADVAPNYVCFDVPNEFLVGYGLDYKGLYRNLPYVGILKPEVYTSAEREVLKGQ